LSHLTFNIKEKRAFTDQYFVCGYVIDDKMINQKGISLYDCDEGDM